MNHRLPAPPAAPWLESVDLVGESVSFSGHRLRYHPVVHEPSLRLRLALPPGVAQQVVLEHRGADSVLAKEVVSLEHGKVEWPVRLLRGWNRLRCSAPGEASKVFVLDVVHKSNTREWLETLIFALAFALLIRTFVLQVFVLPIDSRMETLKAGDRIAVNRLHYLLLAPSRGDLALLENAAWGPARFVIKRVAATPGETAEVRAPDVLVDGKRVGGPFESIRTMGLTTAELPADFPRTRVPPGRLFLVSSSRDVAGKTTCWWGLLDTRAVLGRAFAVVWPWERKAWMD